MEMVKVGITERGDAGLDLSWANKLSSVDACIVITKNVFAPEFRQALLSNKDKCILHATITGHGGTVFEPNVPNWEASLIGVKSLVKAGFPIEQVVIRVDPIIPGCEDVAESVILTSFQRYGFRRFRISILDIYRHVRERFEIADKIASHKMPKAILSHMKFNGTGGITADVNQMLSDVKSYAPGIRIESCAEPGLLAEEVGCISERDLDILGLPHEKLDTSGFQRSMCLCYSGKTELLENKHRCPHQCLYCYWRD